MTIKKFIKQCALLESPIGTFASDIIREKEFSSKKSEKEILSYIEFKSLENGIYEVYNEFIAEYNKFK